MTAKLLQYALTALGVMVALSPIILIHEFGHYIVCRLVGIRVLEFSFGFGKVLWSKKKGHTQYSIRAIPFGGFVNPAGEMFVDADKPKPEPHEFASQKWYKKLAMVVSGAFMNYVLAFVIFAGLAFFVGAPSGDASKIPAVIDVVIENMPAAKAGVLENDKILTINGSTVNAWSDVVVNVNENKKDMLLTVDRAGAIVALTIPLSSFDATGKLGIQVKPLIIKESFFGSIKTGAYQCWYWTKMSITSIYKSFAQKKAPDLAGPVGIVNIIHKATHSSIVDFIWLVGLLSLAVGMFNLFPVPILDGGYAVMFIWEGVVRKPLSEKFVLKTLNVGLVLLVALVLYATTGDVRRIFFPKKEAAVEAPAQAGAQETPKAQENN
ncbi:regulator of sigma E protease [Elusimicrobium posterum]|uniref:M50 family metallopeptidase n=1 Tax=Elusimicrobium posterum TaxID=3116653 RepID=UPI003C75F8F2